MSIGLEEEDKNKNQRLKQSIKTKIVIIIIAKEVVITTKKIRSSSVTACSVRGIQFI